MKKIEAIIRTSQFYQVKEALHKIGIDFFTFEDVKGAGNQKAEERIYQDIEYDPGSIARTKLTLVTKNEEVDAIVDCIMTSARTGEIGDGKIYVSALDEIYRIRSGEKNSSAL